MKIDGTGLECTEPDCIALDYFLGGHSEDMFEWAKRVWDCCKEYKDTDGKGYPGKTYHRLGMPGVYKNDPHVLWENKIRQRRASFVKEYTGNSCSKELLKMENIKDDMKKGKKAEWPYEFSDAKIMEIRDGGKHDYKTSKVRFAESEKAFQKEHDEMEEKSKQKVAVLKTKFDDETIAIIYPQGEKYLEKGADLL